MHQVLGQVLEADSQEEARTRLDDLREQLEKKAASALEILEDGFYDATAAEALLEKYRERLRLADMLERFIQEIGRREVNAPHLPEHRLRVQTCRCPMCGDP